MHRPLTFITACHSPDAACSRQARSKGRLQVWRKRTGGDHGGLALAPLAAAGDFASVDPDESAAHGWMVAVRAKGPGSATLVRRMAVESDRNVLWAANPDRPDMAVNRADETIIRAVAVFVGRAV